MSATPEAGRGYAPEEAKMPLESEPSKLVNDEEVFLKYQPGSVYANPKGWEMKVAGIDFMSGKVILTDISTEEGRATQEAYEYYDPKELKNFKRKLREDDYRGEEFINEKKGWIARVIGCVPEKNILLMKNQEGDEIKVKYDKFVKEFAELPPNTYAAFKGEIVQQKNPEKEFYIKDLDYKDRSITLQEYNMLIDKESGQKIINLLPGTDRRISFDDLQHDFMEPLETSEVFNPFDQEEESPEADIRVSEGEDIIEADYEVVEPTQPYIKSKTG